ncbi:SDR family oxidoreductase [Pararhodobacter aggregans]|uniref:Short-chain dehydrogenase n=1 Tax=Pararhodobacter aggregans TaxID=404875 RepID=A0A2T7US16_9RHOB|nr:SDR family oxidoreductase [Pararhodobacter aggregans]PTX00181.1 NADP-dependent 3-hydroxy acid dehydrogenase YdfG [Pararhodobacter aggregans]PVE47507.1 short-chain dehydrogenase [Pararhodobacter aggregans]
MLLKDRIAIVTGASSGIGLAIAEALAAEGAKVVVAARSADKLAALVAGIEAKGGTALAVPTDMTDEGQVEALFAACEAAFGPPRLVVNNAGIADHTPTVDLTLDRWSEVVAINLTSVFLGARAAFRAMIPAGGGRVINVGSISAKVPRPDTAAYAATKFGLEGLTHSLALDGRPHGIAVSMVHPGSTVSSLVPGITDQPRPGTMAASDVARVVVLMASLPDDVNLYEGTILPVTMPFLGRG